MGHRWGAAPHFRRQTNKGTDEQRNTWTASLHKATPVRWGLHKQ